MVNRRSYVTALRRLERQAEALKPAAKALGELPMISLSQAIQALRLAACDGENAR